MSPSTVHRLPAPIEAAAVRMKQAARQAVDRSIESLGLAALSANSVAQRSELLAAQFELDRKSAMFVMSFDEAFEDRLKRDCAPRESFDRGHSNWSELSLVDDHELEIKVAAERFGLQMAHACEWELRELNAYLGSVLARGRLEQEHNPLRPEVIGMAMIRAAEAMSEREDVRRVLVAEIGRSLAGSLGPTYAAIVADLRGMGIQPAGLSVRITESRPGEAGRGHGGVDSQSDGGTLGGTGPAQRPGFSNTGPGAGNGGRNSGFGSGSALGQVDAAMMSLIRRLAVVEAPSSQGLASSSRNMAWATSESALLGTGTGSNGAMLMAPNLIHVHRDELRAASRGSIDHMVIDVIGSLFDQILSDPKVPPQMARQIARLQLPVLRAALGDPSFFSSRRHPVRRFVNRIASVGTSLEDFSEERAARLLVKVRELVQDVVQGDFEQVDTYEAKLAELEAFVAEESREDVVNEHGDAAALLQQKEDQLRLQRLYSTQLQGELKTVAVPEFLRDFVSQVWSKVMLAAAARDGADSERVKRMKATAGQLLMSVQPKASPSQRKAFLTELPRLMQTLNEGLDLIGFADDVRRTFFGQLLPAHAEALKAGGARTLDYNLMAKRVESVVERPVPGVVDLRTTPVGELPVLADEILVEHFSADEASRLGLVKESAVDWNGVVDIDLSAEPELTAVDIHIEGLSASNDAPEPSRGKSLADHVQIGFAYQMHLQGQWEKVRLAHVSPGRTFYVFTHGKKHKQTVSLTHRMLMRMCETGRVRAFENAYLIERATARARQQLAQLGARKSA
jgi:Protein of unknown function (DUF1631)